MQRRVLLIGNSNGLPGVQRDFTNYKSFFRDDVGGAWRNEEIISRMNPSRAEIISILSDLKGFNLDFVVVIFSGHGGQERETMLELNRAGDLISESELLNIASRQITIYDCCRSYSEISEMSESRAFMAKSAMYHSNIRELYERRIMQAIPQQARLYACAIGENAHDTVEGGVYSKNLLKAARRPSDGFMLLGDAHETASALTIEEVEAHDQHPAHNLLRCLSSQQLIISIRPPEDTRAMF